MEHKDFEHLAEAVSWTRENHEQPVYFGANQTDKLTHAFKFSRGVFQICVIPLRSLPWDNWNPLNYTKFRNLTTDINFCERGLSPLQIVVKKFNRPGYGNGPEVADLVAFYDDRVGFEEAVDGNA